MPRHDELKARVTAFAHAGAAAEELSGLHVAVMQYGAGGEEREAAHGSDQTLAELVELASHTARTFASAASASSAPPGRGVSELLDLLPTIAKVTSAVGGPAYDGAVTAEVLRLATGGAWAPSAVLPVLNLFAELPGVMSDAQAGVLCEELLHVLGAAAPEDFPGICRALVNLVTKHPTSTVWSSTFRAALQGAPPASLSTAFCMIDLALQHAPATGGTLIASFQADTMSQLDVPELMLLLILSQTHAYKEQAFSLLTAGFAAGAELGREDPEGSASDDDDDAIPDHVADGTNMGAALQPADSGHARGGIISAVVQAVTSTDARLARTLTELGLHWCDTASASSRAALLRRTGRHLLSEVFVQHAAARREVLSVAFTAVIEEPSPQVKDSYCSLIQYLLSQHRELMSDHTAVLHAWMSSIQTLPFSLQKRVLDAVLHVAVVNGPLTSHVSMTMRKMMMEKATDSRLVALHGLCAVVRMAVSQGTATHLADIVASLKSAFDMGHSVRKQLYSELASLFRSCKTAAASAVDVHLEFLQQRVCAQFLRYVEVTDAHMSVDANREDDLGIRWNDCFDCVGQHAYPKEPLAELVSCVLQLLSSSTAGSASETSPEMRLLSSSVLSMMRQCCSVGILQTWDEDTIISTEQKLDAILPLQQVLLEWFPSICILDKQSVSKVDSTAATSGDIIATSSSGADNIHTGQNMPQQFWLIESHAMLVTVNEILGRHSSKTIEQRPIPLVAPLRACSMLEPYLTYLSGPHDFRKAFGLPAVPSVTPVADAPEPPPKARLGGGRALRQRRPGKAVPWWVGNKSTASHEKRRNLDANDMRQPRAEDSGNTCSHRTDLTVEKAFPSGVYILTNIIRRHLDGAVDVAEKANGSHFDKNVSDTVVAAFSQLVRLYTITSSMRWDEAEAADSVRGGSDSDDAITSGVDTAVNGRHSFTGRGERERRAYTDAVLHPKLLQPIEAVVPKPKRSKLQLHSQQEMCYYKCRVACLESLTAAVTYAQCSAAAPDGSLELFECPALVEAYRAQDGLDAAATDRASPDLCAVYFSRQLRDEVAAGITPPLLIAYVRWIQCVLHFAETSGPTDTGECRRQVAESFYAILSKFEIDAPGIVKTLLQALLQLSSPRDARDTALCVVQTLLPKKSSSRHAGLVVAGVNGDLLVCASLQCKHAAIRVAMRFLVSEVKATSAESGEVSTLAAIVDTLAALVTEPSAVGARHLPLRPIVAGLVQSTIGRAADVGRVLYDTWPTQRGPKSKRSGRQRMDSIDM